MLDKNTVRDLLLPFEATVSDLQIVNLLSYLALLFRWNKKINLTAIRTPEECITRHFGESFILAKAVSLRGRLLDIGSGAGFPGLAIKLLVPDLEVVLLEPVAKKRAFLKEASRACGMNSVIVSGSRLLQFAQHGQSGSFDMVTARAVGGLDSLIPAAAQMLKPHGDLGLWVGKHQVAGIISLHPGIRWKDPVPIPLSQERNILVGRLKAPGSI